MTRLLHVYGQSWQHSEALVVGNREALSNLKDAIDRALTEGKSVLKAFVADGEGYDLHVVCLDGDMTDKRWIDLMEPYTDETAKDNREGVTEPESTIHGMEKV